VPKHPLARNPGEAYSLPHQANWTTPIDGRADGHTGFQAAS